VRQRFPILCARLRMPINFLAFLLLVGGGFLGGPSVMRWTGLGLLAVGLASLRIGTVRRDPIEVRAPVSGRWVAVNSPANAVPSHGVHAYGQSYAIDLVHEPTEGSRSGFSMWPLARRPEDFPAFGQPILAPADGVVVRTHGRERDHWSRTSLPGLLYLIVEGVLRELTGPDRIAGNHVVIDIGDGVYAVHAHLRKGSIRVRPCQRVRAGEHIADCGNSGNSTEPHLHFQLMEHKNLLFAAGLPFRFERIEVDGATTAGVPANHRPFVVPSDVVPGTGAGESGTRRQAEASRLAS
jgi:murein DD-endopeptidase MepM/ murein hydrolase activator NlpD